MDEQPKVAQQKQAAAALSQADAELRNRFASVALAEIVKWQVAEHKAGQEDVAASWAYRYADRMLAQSKRPVRNMTVNVRGVPGITEEPAVEVQ